MMRATDLILAPDPDAFVAAARPLVADPDSLDALVPDLLRETALRTYREAYPKHVPHALFALLGGLESRDLLGGPERSRPVLQALSYAARERSLAPWPIGDTEPRGDGTALRKGLRDDDFDVAFGAVRALVAAGRLDEVRDILLGEGTGDCFNVCHRFLYAAKALQRIAREPGVDAAALLFPVVHYHVTAPRDDRYGPDLGKPAERTPEEVLAIATRNLSLVEEYDWVPIVHAATLAETALWWAAESDHPDTERGLRLAARFLPDALAEGNVAEGTSMSTDRGPVGTGDLEDVAAAIEARHEAAARGAALGLEGHPSGRSALGTALLLACARVDGSLAFSHDVKVTAGTVHVTRTSDSPHLAHVLSDVAAFLARLPAGSALADALF